MAKASTEPHNPRSFFGSELRRARETAGLDQAGLGKAVHVSGDYVGKLERGTRPPTEEMAQRLDAVLGSDGLFWRLWDLVEHSTDHPAFFALAGELERSARLIEEWEPNIVPGLLQTADYSREVFRAVWPYHSEEKIATMVEARVKRAELLEDDRLEVWAILSESVLHDVLPPGVLAGQLAHIVDLMDNRRVVVQVLPGHIGMHALKAGPLRIMTLDDGSKVAYTEGPHSGHVLDTPKELNDCRRSYDLVRAAAMSPVASLSRIRAAMEESKRDD